MSKYDSMRKTKRDAKIVRYQKAHLDLSQKEIGEKFGICQSVISKILKRAKVRTDASG